MTARLCRSGAIVTLCLALALLGFPAAAFAAPTTTLSGVPDGWSNTDVTLEFSTDIAATTTYMLGTDGAVDYRAPVTVTAEGATPLAYWSVSTECHDENESAQYATIRIDKSAPVSSISGLPAPMSPAAPFTFSISATDVYSGVAQRFYRIDGGAQQPYTAPVLVTPTGSTRIDYWSVDVVGNVEMAKTAAVSIDDGLPRTTISGVPAAWSRSDVVFSLSAAPSAASGQPVASTLYRLGVGAETPYVAPVTVSGEGTTTVSYYSRDAAGGTEGARSEQIRIDKTAPHTDVSGIPGSVSRTAVTLILAATDAVSGVAGIRYKLNDGATMIYGAPVTVGTEGDTTLTYWALDVAGNSEAPHTAHIQIDLGIPKTTVSGVPDGWSTTNVTATLWATVSSFATVAGTFYTYASGSETPYAGPLALTQEGNRTLWYHSVSDTGLRESTHAVQVKIDKSAPRTDVSGIPSGTSPSAVTFSLIAQDAFSGVAAIHYQLGSGTVQDYTAPVVVTADGTTSLTYWAVDVAGNSEAPHTVPIVISRVSGGVPDTSIGGVPAGWSSTNVTFTLSPYSPAHPVIGTYYRLGSGPVSAYTAPVVVSTPGVTSVAFYSTDDAGGREATKTAQVRIDKVAPTSSASGLPAATQIVAGPVGFSLTGSDALSGVSVIRYKFASGYPIDYTGPVSVNYQGTTLLTWWAVDNAGNIEAEHTALIRIASSAVANTSATIKTSAKSVRRGRTVTLSGKIKPVRMIGKRMVVYVKKPGASRWTYSSSRVVYSLSGGAAWQYKYKFKTGVKKGKYKFKATVPASAGFRGSESTAITITVK